MQKIGSKVLAIIVVSMVFGMIGWSTVETIVGEEDATARTFSIIWDILSKCGTAISSALLGFLDGGKFNDYDSDFLNEKIGVHKTYFNDKDFKPLTEEELAREEHIERVRKANEEAAKQLGIWNGESEHKLVEVKGND